MTVHECVLAAARLLTSAGVPRAEAQRDAAVLARHITGWSTAEWAVRLRSEASASLEKRLPELAGRRAAHEPIAYITGTREFYGRPFRVTRDVLIPRPETELVVDAAIAILHSTGPRLVLDIGTGSGCLAVTIALERPGVRVIATDVSDAALAIAAANARALGAEQVEYVQVAPHAFVPPELPPIDMIVSNPPYVSLQDRASLPADVRDFEPAVALFGGDDGLRVIRELARVAARTLRRGGSLVMEMGAGQSDAVARIAADSGLKTDAVLPDLQRIPRVLVAHRPA